MKAFVGKLLPAVCWMLLHSAMFTAVAQSTPTVVHIIPHSHDDPGWQRTVDQYHLEYVRYILDGILASLEQDESKTFVEVEVSFLKRWWDAASDSQRSSFRTLVNKGQIELLNGGWVMADEGTT